MRRYSWFTAWTARGGAWNLRDEAMRLHALHPSLPRASRTGMTYRAVCQAQVRYFDGNGVRFEDIEGDELGRLCPTCMRETSRVQVRNG